MRLCKEHFYTFALEAYDAVTAFHRAFELPIRGSWADSTKSGRLLRANLIEEEFNELVNSVDPVARLDAYCDLTYVLLGTFLELGYSSARLNEPNFHRLPPFAGNTATIITNLKSPTPCFRRLSWALPDATAAVIKEAWTFTAQFPEAFRAVHVSNMSKLWEEAPRNITDVIVKEVYKGKWLVKRKSDGKVLKPSTFVAPELTPFIK